MRGQGDELNGKEDKEATAPHSMVASARKRTAGARSK
jgi:hypothetical protein